MSAQTTSAEDISTRLQNNPPRLVSLTNGLVVTSTTPDLSKSMVFTVPIGKYVMVGTVRMPVTAPVGQWIALNVYHNGDLVHNNGMPTPPVTSDPRMCVTFPVTVTSLDLNQLNFYVCSQSATIQVTHVHLQLIRI